MRRSFDIWPSKLAFHSKNSSFLLSQNDDLLCFMLRGWTQEAHWGTDQNDVSLNQIKLHYSVKLLTVIAARKDESNISHNFLEQGNQLQIAGQILHRFVV